MVNFRKNLPPKYDDTQEHSDNFSEFFDWATSLKNPTRSIKELVEQRGYEAREHSLGFTVVYLSARHQGPQGGWHSGVARAHLYPNDRLVRDDIHSHGFDFVSGVVAGDLAHTRHYPVFGAPLPDGEGFVGYETSVSIDGTNSVVQATDATISIPRHETDELKPGDIYKLGGRDKFHSVGGQGAVTVFCKSPADDISLILRKPEDAAPRDY